MTRINDMFFVLGAQDGEMREIEKILKTHGIAHAHAAKSGARCDSSQAYGADGVVKIGSNGAARQAVLAPYLSTAYVECSVSLRGPELRIDHHNPGDPGYEAEPADFMAGSSLGQTLALLGLAPTPDQRLLAAADHCLSAAYRGECPGVDPGELLFMRAAWQALMTQRSLTQTMASILNASKQARNRFDTRLGASVFHDPTRMPRDLPEGAAYAGLPVIYRSLMPGGALKEMIKGAGQTEIQAFMSRHEGLGRRVYGNPYRGYAGAYIV